MSISFVGVATGDNTTAIPVHRTGDLILTLAMNTGSSSNYPISSAGYTEVAWNTLSSPSPGVQAVLAHKVAGSDNESNSWQHATFFLIAVYRNARYGGMNMGNNSSSATMSWAPVRLDVTDGTSWGVRIGAHRTATNLLSSALTGYAVRSDLNHTAMLSDSAGGITNGGFTQNTSVNATGANRTYNIGLIYTPGEQVETSGQIKVFDGSEFAPKPVKVWNGTEWVTKPVKRWDGSNWVETNY